MRAHGFGFAICVIGIATVAANATTLSPRLTNGTRVAALQGYDIRDCTPPYLDKLSDKWHMFCTVINSSVGPSGYPGEVGHWTVSDEAMQAKQPFDYQGIAVPRGAEGSWDEHGVFTPGFIYDEESAQYVVFYGGVGANFDSKHGSYFSECLGIATASEPSGPYSKQPNPFVCGSGPPTLDDQARAAAEGTPSAGQCQYKELPAGTNLPSDNIAYFRTNSSSECLEWCCQSGGNCKAYTWANSMNSSAAGCAKGEPCCFLKNGAGQPSGGHPGLESGYVTSAILPKNQQWDWIRADNPRPTVFAGRKQLLFKGVASNFTSLPNVWSPANGTGAAGQSWAAAPYAPPYNVSNPIVPRLSPYFPDGFENQEIFRAPAPDGRLHMIASTHGGSRSNAHLVLSQSDPRGLRWEVAESEPPAWSEPAPVARGVPGDALETIQRFVRFESGSECPASGVKAEAGSGPPEDPERGALLVVCLYDVSWVDVTPPGEEA